MSKSKQRQKPKLVKCRIPYSQKLWTVLDPIPDSKWAHTKIRVTDGHYTYWVYPDQIEIV